MDKVPKEDLIERDKRNREAFAKMVERLTGKRCRPDEVHIDYDPPGGNSQEDGGTS